MACARPNILHKQKSCVTDFTTTRIRDRRSQFLHKQYSIDETNLGHQRHPNHNGIGRNEPVVTTAEHNFISQRSSRQYWQPSSSPKRFHRKTQAWTSDNVTCPENSLRISTAIKCKSNEINVNDSSPKLNNCSTKVQHSRNEDKININIFLSHNTNISELDANSDSEATSITYQEKQIKQTSKPSIEAPTKPPAESRRAQFQANRSVTLPDRRPRLVRAMSAPIKPIASELSMQPQHLNKRRLRRKKSIQQENDRFEIQIEQRRPQLFLNNATNSVIVSNQNTRPVSRTRLAKGPKTNQIRTRSAYSGCDIVTLVSLLSPSGSDSEKEEPSSAHEKNEGTSARAPSLRRTGKSVSFQDDDEPSNTTNVRDFSTIFRRASIAPLAAKIRTNRPPTAPPGSIYLKAIEMGESIMAAETNLNEKSANGDHNPNDVTSTATTVSEVTQLIVTAPPSMPIPNSRKNSQAELLETTIFPEYVRSIKEKECWLLFQKMMKKGISVSYETILRGILTPTEVRAVEKKQKEVFERQASLELGATTDCDNSKKK